MQKLNQSEGLNYSIDACYESLKLIIKLIGNYLNSNETSRMVLRNNKSSKHRSAITFNGETCSNHHRNLRQ